MNTPVSVAMVELTVTTIDVLARDPRPGEAQVTVVEVDHERVEHAVGLNRADAL